jgi:hypothetical protein
MDIIYGHDQPMSDEIRKLQLQSEALGKEIVDLLSARCEGEHADIALNALTFAMTCVIATKCNEPLEAVRTCMRAITIMLNNLTVRNSALQ